MYNKVKKLRSRVFVDNPKNPLLDSFDIKNLKTSKERENTVKKKVSDLLEFEEFIEKESGKSLKKYFIEKGLDQFYSDLDDTLPIIESRIGRCNETYPNWHKLNIFEKIFHLLIEGISTISDYEIHRLKFDETRAFYKMHVYNMRKKTLKENIVNTYNFFKERSENSSSIYYIGPTYGEIANPTENYPETKNKVFINLKKKSNKFLINLSISKLKIEDKFISFKIHKIVSFLYDYSLISLDEYNDFIFGTTDEKRIEYAKFGIGGSLIYRLEKDKQLNNIKLDINGNLTYNEDFNTYKKSIDDFFNFEIDRFF